MKNLFLISSFLFITILGCSQQHEAKLLGICSVNQLQQEPYAVWYTQNYSAYNPNAQVLDQLKKTNPSKYTIKIFFGSWCGDSKRELPKMTKVLNEISFAKKSIALIAVDDSTEVYKQSPQREEAGLQIYKVPTFIIYEGSTEIGRIVESPAETIERDLLKIFSKRQYSSNYYRVYIECTEDRAVTPFIQRKMYTEIPCEKVYSLPSSHSPFFSKPQELCAILLTL